MGMADLKMCITCKQKCDRNKCELWCVEWVLFRFQIEIINLAFKWLIVLRSAIKRAIKRTESLKTRLPRPKTRTKRTFARLARRLDVPSLLSYPTTRHPLLRTLTDQ